MIFKSIVTLFVLYYLFNSAQGLKRKNKKISSDWLFQDSDMDWSKTDLKFNIDHPLKSKFHKWGIYFENSDFTFYPKEFVYKHVMETGYNRVIDFVYVKDCEFNLTQNGDIHNLKLIIEKKFPSSSISIDLKIKMPDSFRKISLNDIKFTIHNACMQRKNELNEVAKKIVRQEAKESFIRVLFNKEKEELRKIQIENNKENKANQVKVLLGNIVGKDEIKKQIKQEKDNAVKIGDRVLYARRLTYGPQLIIDCPTLKSSQYPYLFRLKFEDEKDSMTKTSGHNTFFYPDFKKKQYRLAIRGDFFPTDSKIKIEATLLGVVTCESNLVKFSERSFENNTLTYKVGNEDSQLKFKDCNNLCAPIKKK